MSRSTRSTTPAWRRILIGAASALAIAVPLIAGAPSADAAVTVSKVVITSDACNNSGKLDLTGTVIGSGSGSANVVVKATSAQSGVGGPATQTVALNAANGYTANFNLGGVISTQNTITTVTVTAGGNSVPVFLNCGATATIDASVAFNCGGAVVGAFTAAPGVAVGNQFSQLYIPNNGSQQFYTAADGSFSVTPNTSSIGASGTAQVTLGVNEGVRARASGTIAC